ncbi:hypothetical protein ACJX0J_012212, partial [Zea mays]
MTSLTLDPTFSDRYNTLEELAKILASPLMIQNLQNKISFIGMKHINIISNTKQILIQMILDEDIKLMVLKFILENYQITLNHKMIKSKVVDIYISKTLNCGAAAVR